MSAAIIAFPRLATKPKRGRQVDVNLYEAAALDMIRVMADRKIHHRMSAPEIRARLGEVLCVVQSVLAELDDGPPAA